MWAMRVCPAPDQMASRVIGTVFVFDEYLGHRHARNILVNQHHVGVSIDVFCQGSIIRFVRHHDQTVDMLVLEPPEISDFTLARTARAGHQHRVSVQFRLVLDRGRQFRKKRIGNLRGDQSDRLGPARTQSSGEEIRPITETFNSRVDAQSRRRGQFDTIVKIPGNGSRGVTGFSSHLAYRCHSAPHVSN